MKRSKKNRLNRFRHYLSVKIIGLISLILFLSFSMWAYFNIRQYKQNALEDILVDCDRLSRTIMLGVQFPMMYNQKSHINQILKDIALKRELILIRIINKTGQIKYSSQRGDLGRKIDQKDMICAKCHQKLPPRLTLPLAERILFPDKKKHPHRLSVVSPIQNTPSCGVKACHPPVSAKKLLGVLDIHVSTLEKDRRVAAITRRMLFSAGIVFLITTVSICLVFLRYFIDPVQKLIHATRSIAHGDADTLGQFNTRDEIGRLAKTIRFMGRMIHRKQAVINKQKDEYKNLFELVPCYITVQDKDYKLIRYNKKFANRFHPVAGDYCYSAYKDRQAPCKFCPVKKTFHDGKSHYSEETAIKPDGSVSHWIVKTAPMKNAKGDIIAAMEMSLDITHIKQLENKLARSEQKYYAIFNNIPNPVFVLDGASLTILNCNKSVYTVYGYHIDEVLHFSFLDFFAEGNPNEIEKHLKAVTEWNTVKHLHKSGEIIYVNIRIAPAPYPGGQVFFVTTSDITKRLEAEMQLVQAGKMATLGEMATGIAHELNQPLSVIKTASSFFMKKVRKKESIKADIMYTLSEEIDQHVDRAANIINHLRQFGRKSDISRTPVQVNTVLASAFDMFSQQLKLKEIQVDWALAPTLPEIMAETSRLEQVFINLLINARDAIEEKWAKMVSGDDTYKKITLKTYAEAREVWVEVIDNGMGIPANIVNKIFDPFFTTKRVGEGTGLGLSISYGIVKEFNGDIKIVSTPGTGSRFIIRFPAKDGYES